MARSAPKTPTASIVPFGLRMQPSLKAQLEKSAEGNGRSLNAEIVARLEKSLEQENELAATIASHAEDIRWHGEAISDYERRIELLESWVSDLRETQGLGGVGRDK